MEESISSVIPSHIDLESSQVKGSEDNFSVGQKVENKLLKLQKKEMSLNFKIAKAQLMVILIRILIALINKMDWIHYYEYVGSSIILIGALSLHLKKVYSMQTINRLLQVAVIASGLWIMSFIKNKGDSEVWAVQLILSWSFLSGVVLIMSLD